MARRAALLAAAVALAACARPPFTPVAEAPGYTPPAPLPGAVAVAFALPRDDGPHGIFELPWPTELLRRADGRPDLRAYPGRDTLVFGEYVAAAEQDVEGYSVSPAIYFHFTGPLAAPRLPASVRAGMSAASPVFLVDVDPASPDRGTFIPIEHRFYREALRYLPASTLALKPVAGAILRPGTLYAAVVTRDLGGAGAELGTTLDLEIVKSTHPCADAREESARILHGGALDQIAALGVPRERVAALALFRTQTPERVTERFVDVLAHLSPRHAPRLIEAEWVEARGLSRGPGAYATIEGTYCTPNFQVGIERAPFLAEEGGRLALDARGAPRVVELPLQSPYRTHACGGLIQARFVLTIPARPMPPAGFPLLISAHGTGGDAETFLGDDDFAGWAAREGIAVVSTDQPLHGGRGPAPRPGSLEPLSLSVAGFPVRLVSGPGVAEVAFYNPIHPAAARDNLRQAAADVMVLARLFTSADLGPLLGDGRRVPRFDPARVLAAGHSQGSQSVAAAGAVDPMIRGVILSGCGGDARLGVLGRSDLPVVPIFGLLLGLPPGELDELHPFMALVQTLADPIDPASYARLYWDPPPGRARKSVLHYEGMTDTYAPPATAEALAVALRATPLAPVVKAIAGLGAPAGSFDDLLGRLGRGGAVRAFAQYRSTQRENGHFVLYHEPGAAELAMRFMRAVVAAP